MNTWRATGCRKGSTGEDDRWHYEGVCGVSATSYYVQPGTAVRRDVRPSTCVRMLLWIILSFMGSAVTAMGAKAQDGAIHSLGGHEHFVDWGVIGTCEGGPCFPAFRVGGGLIPAAAPVAFHSVSCNCCHCGAKGFPHATAPLCDAALLGPYGGGEEAGGAWPGGRGGQRGADQGRRAADAMPRGPFYRHGGRWGGVGEIATVPSGALGRTPTSAAAAGCAAYHHHLEEGMSLIQDHDRSSIRKGEEGDGDMGCRRGERKDENCGGGQALRRHRRRLDFVPLDATGAAIAAARGREGSDVAARHGHSDGTAARGDGREHDWDGGHEHGWNPGDCWHGGDDPCGGGNVWCFLDGDERDAHADDGGWQLDGGMADGDGSGRMQVTEARKGSDDDWDGDVDIFPRSNGHDLSWCGGRDDGVDAMVSSRVLLVDGGDRRIYVHLARPARAEGDATRSTQERRDTTLRTLGVKRGPVVYYLMLLHSPSTSTRAAVAFPPAEAVISTKPLHEPSSSTWEVNLLECSGGFPFFTMPLDSPSSSRWEASSPRIGDARGVEQGCSRPAADMRKKGGETPRGWGEEAAATAWVVAVVTWALFLGMYGAVGDLECETDDARDFNGESGRRRMDFRSCRRPKTVGSRERRDAWSRGGPWRNRCAVAGRWIGRRRIRWRRLSGVVRGLRLGVPESWADRWRPWTTPEAEGAATAGEGDEDCAVGGREEVECGESVDCGEHRRVKHDREGKKKGRSAAGNSGNGKVRRRICSWKLLGLVLFVMAVTRIGEASHPGPATVRRQQGKGRSGCEETMPRMTCQYPRPGKVGFWGARHAELIENAEESEHSRACMIDGEGGVVMSMKVKERRGAPPPPPPDKEQFALAVETANGTTWETMKKYLVSPALRAHVLLIQETHLGEESIKGASAWALANGWKSIWSAATPGKGTGNQGGVAILARSYLGLSDPPWGYAEIEPGRAVAGLVEAPGIRPMVCVAGYLRHGEGLSAANRATLANIGARLEKLGHGAADDGGEGVAPVPFVVGADFNLLPAAVEASGFASKLGATIVTPRSRRGTCRTAGAARTIDFFVVSGGLHMGIDSVHTVEDSPLKTHVPVRLNFHPRLTSLRALAIRDPPKLPCGRVHGPVRPPPTWHGPRATAEEAAKAAKGRNRRKAAELLDKAYKDFCDLAEQELQEITGCRLKKVGSRGLPPKLCWRSILPERKPGYECTTRVSICRCREARMREMFGIAEVGGDGATEDAKERARELLECLRESAAAAARQQGEQEGRSECEAKMLQLAEELMQLLDEGAGITPVRMMERQDWCQRAGELLLDIVEEGKAAEAEDLKGSKQRWTEWVTEGLGRGAKNAFKASRLPEAWKPTTAEEPDGTISGDPLKLLEAQRREYAALWMAEEGRAKEWQWASCDSLPRPSAGELRAASRSFRAETSQTYDGLHVKHFSLLSDAALETLAAIMEAMESGGRVPSQIHLVTMPTLPKPSGGFRLIGIFPATYRLWARVRKPYAEAWETNNDRPFFAAAAGRGAVDVVWRQALRAEAAVASQSHAASVLTDMAKFYEHIDHQKLIERGARSGFPMPLMKVAVAAHSGPRMIRMNGFVGEELHAGRGIIAGCGLATTLVKVYSLEPYDRLVKRVPDMFFDNYLDDNHVGAEGTYAHVKATVVKGARAMKEIIEEDLGCRLARDKTEVVASSDTLAKEIMQELGKEFGSRWGAAAASNLGTDYAAGKMRRAHGANSRRKQRLRKGRKRQGRIAKLRAALKDKAVKVFASGVQPAMTFGAAVHGLSDRELRDVRLAAAASMSPRARGRSLLMLLLVYGDPTWRAGVEPFLQYARVAWAASTGLTGKDGVDLTELRRAWEQLDKESLVQSRSKRGSGSRGIVDERDREEHAAGGADREARWDRVRGPLGALFLSLRRIGWEMRGPFQVADDCGKVHNLLDHSPAMWSDMIKDAVLRSLERAIGRKWAKNDKNFAGRRVCIDHLKGTLTVNPRRRARGVGALDAGIARTAICGGLWTNQRAHEADARVCKLCRLCGKAPDTLHHRMWWCEATEEDRKAHATEELVREARAAGPTARFFTSGVIPHPGDVWPKVTDDVIMHTVRPGGGEGDKVSGHVFIDGSCTTNPIKELRRASMGIVMTDDNADPLAVIQVPLWRGLPQTPQAAEYTVYALVTLLLEGPTILYGDCQNVVDQAEAIGRQAAAEKRGRRGSTSLDPKLRYAAVLRSTLKRPEQRAMITAFHKVKAHRDWKEIEDASEKFTAKGNAHADEAAKEGLRLHDQPGREQELLLEAELGKARQIVKLLTHALKKWPAEAKRFNGRRAAGERAPPADGVARRTHRWEHADGAWRCVACRSSCFAEFLSDKRRNERCKGGEEESARDGPSTQGHALRTASCQGLPVDFCVKCGAWAMRRRYNLGKICTGVPTPAGRQALMRLAKGRHPWVARGGREEDRGQVEVVDARCLGPAGDPLEAPGGHAGSSGDACMAVAATAAAAAAARSDDVAAGRHDAQVIDVGDVRGAALSADVAGGNEGGGDGDVAGWHGSVAVSMTEEGRDDDGVEGRPPRIRIANPRRNTEFRSRAAAGQSLTAAAKCREYLMAASMASHAERVARKREREEGSLSSGSHSMSAKERLEALRRRVEMKKVSQCEAANGSSVEIHNATAPADEERPGGGVDGRGDETRTLGTDRTSNSSQVEGGGEPARLEVVEEERNGGQEASPLKRRRVVGDSARASCTINSAADAREGPGGPLHEAGATAAVATQVTAVATAAVTAECRAVPLVIDDLTARAPPDGRVAPSGGRVSATAKRPASTFPQVWPQRLERERAAFQGEDFSNSMVDGPPKGKARRREGVGEPHTNVSAAWCDATAAGPGAGNQPSEGCAESAHGARNECADDCGGTVDGEFGNELSLRLRTGGGGIVLRRVEDLPADGQGCHDAALPRAHVFPGAADVRRRPRLPGEGDSDEHQQGGEEAGRAVRDDRGVAAAAVRRRITGKRKPEREMPGPRKAAAYGADRGVARRADDGVALPFFPVPAERRPGVCTERELAAGTAAQGSSHCIRQRELDLVPGGVQPRGGDGMHRIDDERGERGSVACGGKSAQISTSRVRDALRGGLAATTVGSGEEPYDGGSGKTLGTATKGEMNTEKCTSSSSSGPAGGAAAEEAIDAAAVDLDVKGVG